MLGTISTGAVDDIQRATQLARRMVTEFGMSEKLGSVRYAGQHLQYLGTAVAEGTDASVTTHETIDAEVRRIVGEQFERAKALVAAHRDALSQLSAQLLNAESLDGGAVRAALSSAAETVAS
jgi:cell division protease FtsH